MSESSATYRLSSKIASLLAGAASIGDYHRLTDRTARVVWDPVADRAGDAADHVALVLGGQPEKPSVLLSDLGGWLALQQAVETLAAFPAPARTQDVLEAVLNPAVDRIALQAQAALRVQAPAYLANLPDGAISPPAAATAQRAEPAPSFAWSPGTIAYLVGVAIVSLVAVKLAGILGMAAVWAIAEGIRRLAAGRAPALPIVMVAGGCLFWVAIGFALLIGSASSSPRAAAPATASAGTPTRAPYSPPQPAAAADELETNQAQAEWDAIMVRWETDNAAFLQDPERRHAMQVALDANDAASGGQLSNAELLKLAEADAFRATRWDPRTQTAAPKAPDTRAIESYLRSVPELRRD